MSNTSSHHFSYKDNNRDRQASILPFKHTFT